MSTPRRIRDVVKMATCPEVPSDEELVTAKRAQAEALERLRREMPDVALEADSRRCGYGRGYTPLAISSVEERQRFEHELHTLDQRRLCGPAFGRRRMQILAAIREWDEAIVEIIPAQPGISIFNRGDRHTVFAFARLRAGSVVPMTWEHDQGEDQVSLGTLAPYPMPSKFAANRRLERELDGDHVQVNIEIAN